VNALCEKAQNQNPWFTPSNTKMAIHGIRSFLDEGKLGEWTSRYTLQPKRPLNIGVAMAGNIPLVGFHDALCVLLSGHHLSCKLSSQDSILLPYFLDRLALIEPACSRLFSFEERLKNMDAAIATGSDNTSRYFEYYFRDIPHIIRKNRSSCAVILGEERDEDLDELSRDVYSYFGLGCRSVSKLFVPESYSFTNLLRIWEKNQSNVRHHKYVNNYDYQKSIMLVNQQPFYDNGNILLLENEKLVSPIAVIHYEHYRDQEDLADKINASQSKLQCMVSAKGWYKESERFGASQFPDVTVYADHIDTLEFLSSL
jgi:hypothetical protein